MPQDTDHFRNKLDFSFGNQCRDCVHLDRSSPTRCNAFPEGIPDDIRADEFDHRTKRHPTQSNEYLHESREPPCLSPELPSGTTGRLPTAEERLRFLQDVQRLIDEGLFSATYKFALLSALADLAVAKGDVGGGPLSIEVSEIAECLIECYWRQSFPFPSSDGGASVLLQNKGRQAAVVGAIQRTIGDVGGSLARAKHDQRIWGRLVGTAKETICDQPLWKLQRVRGGVHDFLYAQGTGQTDSICLRPGVAYCLREFRNQVQTLVQGAWVRWIREARQNGRILGEAADLHSFLFGSERADLSAYVPLLKDLQKDSCFYCGGVLKGRGEVDHFVPWSRYQLDLGQNFVLAHSGCNNDKSDVLAAVPHLHRWVERNRINSDLIGSYLADEDLAGDPAAVDAIAKWAYGQTEISRGLVWDAKDMELVRLEPQWRACWQL